MEKEWKAELDSLRRKKPRPEDRRWHTARIRWLAIQLGGKQGR